MPQRIKDKAALFWEQFADLVSREERRRKEVEQTVNSWEEFVAGMDDLSGWLRSEVDPELAELRQVEDFAMEFSSHQARLEVSNLLVIPQSHEGLHWPTVYHR